MYLIDFFKTLIRKSNWGIFLYLILNILVISLFQGFLGAIIIYAISLPLALSPVGEQVIRKISGVKEIKRKDMKERYEPIFQVVYEKAKQKDPNLATDIRLFYSNDPFPNAFALGRKTICVTKGLLQLPEEEIEAIIAHEFGHLSHKDTDIALVITVGNLFATAFMLIARIGVRINEIMRNKLPQALGMFLAVTLLIAVFMRIWTAIGFLFVRHSNRQNEYEADQFAYELGYGNELASALDKLNGEEPEDQFIKTLYSTHPPSDDRIGYLQEMGADYASY